MFMHSCRRSCGRSVRYGGSFSFFVVVVVARPDGRDVIDMRHARFVPDWGVALFCWGGSLWGACCPIVALAPPLAAGRPPAGRAPAADRLRAWRRPGAAAAGWAAVIEEREPELCGADRKNKPQEEEYRLLT